MGAQAITSEKSEVRGFPVTVPRMTAAETATEVFGGQQPVADLLGVSLRALYDKRHGNTGVSDAEVRTMLRAFTAMAARCQRIADSLLIDLGEAPPAEAPTTLAGASA